MGNLITPEFMIIVGLAAIGGWVFTTWLRVKNGYPLEGSWGQALKPVTDNQAKERVALLTTENAELRAEMGAVKDRLANVERIVTDRGYHLGAEIDALRAKALEGQPDQGNA
ncbi:MAG: hypothetical protein V2I27_01055 [Erythrobacter sp.]|jgi:hypothetical protein|nr:hypothetical protein [Erythrobacter sp.]